MVIFDSPSTTRDGEQGHVPVPASELTASSELTEQLEEIDRCLERMDAVIAMLEADLDRRDATMRALLAGTDQLDPAGARPPSADAETTGEVTSQATARQSRAKGSNRKSRTRRSRTRRARTRRSGGRRANRGRRA